MNKQEWLRSYTTQRTKAETLTPALIQLLNDVLTELGAKIAHVRISTIDEDIRDGVDVIVTSVTGEEVNIGLRVRSYAYLSRYPNEFTIRDQVNRHGQTEFEKVKAGKIDGMLYAFASEDGSRIICWRLLRMKALRLALDRDPSLPSLPMSGIHHVIVEHCRFWSFNVKDFPSKALIIAEGDARSLANAAA